MELAWRLWGARRRRNAELRALAWAVHMTMQPHVSERSKSAIAQDRLFYGITRGQLDEDEV